ncbi:MAG: TrbC/VirB2 family protein [Candidatus Peribacteraceae bacterium]|jgi:type IV secretory pathway VirB2 component (pilin)
MHTLAPIIRRITSLLSGAIALALLPIRVAADLGDAGEIDVPGGGNIRGTLENILTTVLSYVGLIAVIVIVIAGIMMVVSAGDESTTARAKKAILYVVVGLILIILASAIVTIISNIGSG